MRLLLALAAVGFVACRNDRPKPDEIVKPSDTSSAPSASASPSGTASVGATASGSAIGDGVASAAADIVCKDGVIVTPPAPPPGSLGLSGTGVGGGGTEGIGLGSIGSLGHGSGGGAGVSFGMPAGAVVTGTTHDVVGALPADEVAKILCASFVPFRACFATTGGLGAASSVDLDVSLAPGGAVTDAHEHTASLSAVAPCAATELKKLVFPATKGSTTFGYALAFAPPVGMKMKEAGATVTGKLPPEVIRRIVRANFPRLRFCYEKGLKADPTLKGTVVVKFVIDAKGSVTTASLGAGTLTDPTVSGCMLKVFEALTFPEPESGTVSVTYPLELDPP